MDTHTTPPRVSRSIHKLLLLISVWNMGLRSSKTAPEHTQYEEDRHSAWGSEIDRSLCGPGTICEDDWTPMNSLPPTPEFQRRKISEMRIEDEVITEQPRLFENFQSEEDNMTNFDVMTVHEIDGFSPIMVAPVAVPAVIGKKKRKIRKRRVKKSTEGRKKKSRRLGRKSLVYGEMEMTETPVLRSYNKSRQVRHVQRHRPRKHHIIHVRRIRIHQDPRYPQIPPPNSNPKLKFRRGHQEDRNRYSKAVPPSHLKGHPRITAKPHFRYRGIPKIIV